MICVKMNHPHRMTCYFDLTHAPSHTAESLCKKKDLVVVG